MLASSPPPLREEPERVELAGAAVSGPSSPVPPLVSVVAAHPQSPVRVVLEVASAASSVARYVAHAAVAVLVAAAVHGLKSAKIQWNLLRKGTHLALYVASVCHPVDSAVPPLIASPAAVVVVSPSKKYLPVRFFSTKLLRQIPVVVPLRRLEVVGAVQVVGLDKMLGFSIPF